MRYNALGWLLTHCKWFFIVLYYHTHWPVLSIIFVKLLFHHVNWRHGFVVIIRLSCIFLFSHLFLFFNIVFDSLLTSKTPAFCDGSRNNYCNQNTLAVQILRWSYMISAYHIAEICSTQCLDGLVFLSFHRGQKDTSLTGYGLNSFVNIHVWVKSYIYLGRL